MTSLVFMLRLVPAPPWNTSMGNWSMHLPWWRIWSHAHTMASHFFAGRVWSRRLASAAAFFTCTMPRMKSGTSLMVFPEMWKLSMARRVWMP